MIYEKLIRLVLLPVGLLIKLCELSIVGSRDIYNKKRFRTTVVDKNCCINKLTQIGQHCHILENTTIINSSIDRFSYIGRNSLVQNASIGSFCSIANDVYIGLGAHPFKLFSTSPLFYKIKNTLKYKLIDHDYIFNEYKQIEIGHDVWIGSRAIIMDGIKIGNGAIIAANAVVTKNVQDYAVVGGVPAQLISYRFDQNKINKLLDISWWDLPLNDIKQRINELNNL